MEGNTERNMSENTITYGAKCWLLNVMEEAQLKLGEINIWRRRHIY
jgi:hypothetical protein